MCKLKALLTRKYFPGQQESHYGLYSFCDRMHPHYDYLEKKSHKTSRINPTRHSLRFSVRIEKLSRNTLQKYDSFIYTKHNFFICGREHFCMYCAVTGTAKILQRKETIFRNIIYESLLNPEKHSVTVRGLRKVKESF